MQKLITNLNYSLKEANNFSDVIFLCIGSNKIIGDAFGPIVGHKLKQIPNNLNIIGDLENCVIYKDIEKIEKQIHEKYVNPYIICIDAALSKTIQKGKIVVEKSSMQIGNVLGKKEKNIGNLSIKGIVAKKRDNYKENFIALAGTSFSMINSMAERVVEGVYFSQIWK